jgi:PhzF family phenazine biosynthesis protein
MVEVEHWSAFRRGQAGGNPCPVVTEARRLTPGHMQAIARHYGHESVFVTALSPSRVSLRFFVPQHEMRMCVHATIAVITSLARSGAIAAGDRAVSTVGNAGVVGAGGDGVVSTASGEHRVSWTVGDQPEVTVEQAAPWFGPAAAVHAELSAALGLPPASIAVDAPIQAVSVSRPKLIVPLRDATSVHQASPDFQVLWELCRGLGTTGAYIFAPHPDGDPRHVAARQFPVDAGYPEDPATGVAAAALAAYLAADLRPAQPTWQRIAIDQGDTMGQPSLVRAAALTGPDGTTRTSVTGQAVRTGHEQLSLSAVTDGLDLSDPEEPELR